MKRVLSCLLSLGLLATTALAADPPPPFASQTPSPAPDYGRMDSWAATAWKPGASSAVPANQGEVASAPEVDVFYIHPTTDRSTSRWNQDLADGAVNDWTDASVIARQAGLFNGCCRIYAPRYRQATRLAFTNMAGDGQKAFDLAYTDVLRAFDLYLKRDNAGRPFILAGHSQGASHLMRLLKDRIDASSLQRRMVAAYVVGVNLSEGDFPRTYKTLSICAKPADTGCVIAWNAVTPETDLALMGKANAQRFVGLYGDVPGQEPVCVNPLTFDRDRPVAAARLSLGAVPGDLGEGVMLPTVAKSVAARCEKGFLVVDADPTLGLKPLPGGILHYHDYGLFYADIRANVTVRMKAFLAAGR
ncbi:DUF3089 domain-containing protein [Niveispirillum sp. KHB5.9]|uniref:DUF3089 domain-containing protein n=1 Tax=Niveispirillum sp. KHB5.9 TaxID=3400269 RepID=UPI003A87E368